MRYYLCVILTVLLFLFVGALLAQPNPIPNAGFEHWTDGEPDGWTSSNDFDAELIVAAQSSDKHSGSSALELKVIVVNDVIGYPGSVGLQDLVDVDAFESNPAALDLYVKHAPVGGSIAYISVLTYGGQQGVINGSGTLVITEEISTYTKVSVPIDYISEDKVQNIFIQIYGGSTLVTAGGSSLWVDDLSFSGTASAIDIKKINIPVTTQLEQNYPNPFNPNTTIYWQLAENGPVELAIFDMTGAKITTLVNEYQQAGEYKIQWDASDLASGVYYYTLRTASSSDTKKMLLVK